MSYKLIFADSAIKGLEKLHAFAADIDPDMAECAPATIASAWQILTQHPYACRKAHNAEFGSGLREHSIDFGSSSYLVLFEARGNEVVLVLAARHQRESDYN